MLGLKRTRFEAALEKLHDGLAVKGRLKRYDRMLESIGRLKQRFSTVARHYEVTVEKAKTGPNATAVRFGRRHRYDEADDGAGAYVLRTSHVDWDIETVLRTYWRISDIEATFTSLKTEKACSLGILNPHSSRCNFIRASSPVMSPFPGSS